jgi:hypothetical protein
MAFISATQVQAHPVDWLWPGRLARGQLHLLDGDPGLGKSLVLIDLAARLSSGRPFPEATATLPPTAVVLITAEDSAGDVVLPRLIAAGADRQHITLWERLPGEPSFRFPSQIERLAEVVRQKQAGLVVLDPLLAFLDPSVNIGSDPSVRQALAALTDLAAAQRCALLALRHLNKGSGTHALYRGLASIAFMAVSRLAWLAGRDPKVPEQFVLSSVKNNLDPPQPSLAYRIRSVPGDVGDVGCVEWLGLSPWTELDLLRANPARRQKRQRACLFLQAFLREGPRTTQEVFQKGKAQGLSRRTLQRAAEDLKVRSERVARSVYDIPTYWLLAGQELPAQLRPPGYDELQAALREAERQAELIQQGLWPPPEE